MTVKKSTYIYLLLASLFLGSCDKNETAIEIIDQTIQSIDNIESIYYKQDMLRTDPRQLSDTISRFREMYFKRLLSDSIVGVKGHWYMYIDDKETVVFEDIFDGNRLIRKNNRDNFVRVYDLNKYPDFRKSHFWGHNTLYGMQHEFRYMLNNEGSYTIKRLNDTIFMGKKCYQIFVRLEDMSHMPGFGIQLEESEGAIAETLYIIDKKSAYPPRVKGENYSREDPEQRFFIDQVYYDIEYNIELDENIYFNTSNGSVTGYSIIEMKPS